MNFKNKWLKHQKFLLKKANIFKHLEQVCENLEKGCDHKKSLKKDFNPVLYWKKRIQPVKKDEFSYKPKKRGILDDLKEVAGAMRDIKTQLNLPSNKKLLEVTREHAGPQPKDIKNKLKDIVQTLQAYQKVKESIADKSLKGLAQHLRARTKYFQNKDIQSIKDAISDVGATSLRAVRNKINQKIKKDDWPHAPGSPEDSAHDVVEENSDLKEEIKKLKSSKEKEKMLEHLRTLKDKSKWRSQKNQLKGKD